MKDSRFEIGKVDIMKKFSFFEIEKSMESEVLASFKGADFDGREVIVEVSKPEPKGGGSKAPKEERSFRNDKTKKKRKYKRN